MLRTLLIAITLLALPGLAQAAQESRDVAQFTAVTFNGAAKINVTVGKERSVRLEGSTDLLHDITTEVHDGTLEIKRRGRERRHSWSFFDFLEWLGSPSEDRERDDLTITISVPRLQAFTVEGAAQLEAEGFDGGDVSFNITGASQFRASGRVDNLSLMIAGAGQGKLGDLIATNATVNVSGAGQVVVQPKESLNAQINGFGQIKYIGDPPEITRNIAGMGTIEKQ